MSDNALNHRESTALFLSAHDYRLLLETARRTTFRRNEVILAEGSQRQAIFVLQKGHTRVERAYFGKGVPVGRMGPGEVFGEVSFLEAAGASATVVADEDGVDVDVIEGARVHALLASDPGLSTRFYQSLATTLAHRLRRLVELVPPALVEDVAVVGASGDMGREIVARLLSERVLAPTQRLQLVGRPDGSSATRLLGIISDLSDAYAETRPHLDLALDPDLVSADVVVMAAGVTLGGGITSRQDLARTNLPIFDRYARALASRGHGHEVVLVVSNPVELGVEVFSQYLGRHRVIGIGAYSDSLRFRRELAHDLGVRRQRVEAFVVGEHGDGMVPLWSSVYIHGLTSDQQQATVARLRGDRAVSSFPTQVAEHKRAVWACLNEGRVREAFERVDSLPPDVRVVLRPYATHFSGAKTAAATAAVTVDLVRTLLDGREAVVSGQVRLEGEFYDLRAPVGVPIVVSRRGWTRVVPLQLWSDEIDLLTRQTENVMSVLRECISA